MKKNFYLAPAARLVQLTLETYFLGSAAIPGYPGSDDPIIDEGDLD